MLTAPSGRPSVQKPARFFQSIGTSEGVRSLVSLFSKNNEIGVQVLKTILPAVAQSLADQFSNADLTFGNTKKINDLQKLILQYNRIAIKHQKPEIPVPDSYKETIANTKIEVKFD